MPHLAKYIIYIILIMMYIKWWHWITKIILAHWHTRGIQSRGFDFMMTSSNGKKIRVTSSLWRESTTVDRWIPITKASDAELWCFLWSAHEQTVEQTIKKPVIWGVIAPFWRHCNVCSLSGAGLGGLTLYDSNTICLLYFFYIKSCLSLHVTCLRHVWQWARNPFY